MNCYLVIASMTMDDIPLRVFATKEEAERYFNLCVKVMSGDDLWGEVISASDATTMSVSSLRMLRIIEYVDGSPSKKN